ncbi:unnamed protein product, partial [Prorocentrum cordatum]
ALGTDAWVGGARAPEEHRSLEVLGASLRTPAFAARQTQERTDEERRFLQELPHLSDLRCAWALLLYCAVPRCNHVLRKMPPSLYAEGRDCSLQEALCGLLDLAPTPADAERLFRASSLPLGLGSLGRRVCREAGGRVCTNVFLRDMKLPGIGAYDGRRIDVVANGLPASRSRQVAIDACTVSPLMAAGRPAARRRCPGLARQRARHGKQTTFPQLAGSRRSYLLVAGAETGGSWDEEAYKFLVVLAPGPGQGRACCAPRVADNGVSAQ